MPTEQTVTIRQPATANLMIDSKDRDETAYVSAYDFQITRNNSIMNGFFTRVGTTEVVLEWCVDNIYPGFNELDFDISGATGVLNAQTITFNSGFYTVEQVLDSLVSQLNDLSGTTGSTFSIGVDLDGGILLEMDTGTFTLSYDSPLSLALGLVAVPAPGEISQPISACADLRRYRYLDFVSQQLTYNQDLKDNSTATFNRDVLCRWYMAWDVEPQYDGYGFPILMGYKKFVTRRLFNPPKQIRWSNNQPLGNISFQVYGDDGKIVSDLNENNEWLMTLQFSEN